MWTENGVVRLQINIMNSRASDPNTGRKKNKQHKNKNNNNDDDDEQQ